MSTPTTGSSTEASPTPPSEDHPEEQTKHGPSGQGALRPARAASQAVGRPARPPCCGRSPPHRPSSGCSRS